MATNLKGKGRFVSLLLLHGEKIAVAVVAAIALLFVYKAIYLPRLSAEFQADKLQAEITRTSGEIKDYTWDKAVADHPDKVRKPQPITAKGDGTVDPAQYINRDADNKPVFGIDSAIVAPLILRKDPVIINAVDVRATGGSGLFAFVDEKIRQAQQLKMAEQAKEAEKKALEKQKKDQLKAKESSGGGRRGPGEGLNEPIDSAHPKRHLIQSGVRPTGNALQGGERIERAYWACVVAKVPIREQLKLYQDALEKARGSDPAKDFPSYVGFYVERAEVLPGKELKWDPVPLYDGQQQSIAAKKSLTMAPAHGVAKRAYEALATAAASFWAGGMAPDVVDSRYAEYPLTLPLPPLVGREWGAEATHPDIPWGPFTPVLEPETPQAAPDAAAQPATDTGGEFGQANPTQQNVPSMGPGYGTGRPGGPGGFPGGGFGRGMGPEGGMGPGMGGPGGGRFMGPGGGPEGGPGGMRSSGPGQVAGQHETLPKGVDYYLLRFFDFSVEPGKKYKYRVKLVIQDPNFNLPQTALDATVLDRQAKEAQAAKAKKLDKPSYRIVKEWSDPSPAVGIPMAGTVHLAETKIPSAEKVNDEPLVKMIVEAFDADEAGTPIQGVKEMDFRRGYVANTIGDARYQPDPTMVDTQSNFKFFTGMTLLDVDGGGKLTKDMTYPARVLVMGPAGELYIRNDTDDKPYVQSFHAIFDETTGRRGGPEGPGVPGGPGNPGTRRQPTRR
ncbi:MAG TPA: hypothetical protein VGI40_10425 [Pirellulaceae bacterium]|jgi:hypothetical protein